MVQFDEDKQNLRLSEFKKREQEHLAQRLAEKNNLEYLDLSIISINSGALSLLSEKRSRESKIAIFGKINKKLKVAVQSPENEKSQEVINELEKSGFEITLYVVSNESLEKAWKVYEDISLGKKEKSGSIEILNEKIKELKEKINSTDDIQKEIENTLASQKSSKATEILEIIIAGSLSLKVSDLHFEPTEENLRLRFRIDGALTDIASFDLKTYSLILSRVKLLSGMLLNVASKAQDGRFSIELEESEIEIRSSVIPGAYGESIVLRILDPDAISVSIEDLGMHPILYKAVTEEINKPNGMILNTGPTGSGKTTTLYAVLRKIYSPERKILTIENPVEYHLEGIVQTQTDSSKGYTFAEGLRSALRQDPDVIMVGEIRDEETATTAVNAALTGHLVFSTLHTNTAAGTFPRLIDLGINPKVISSSVNLAMAQRLLRKLCPECKKEVNIEGENGEILKKILDGIENKEYTEGLQNEKMWEAGEGCDKCHNGYKGRIGVFEAIRMDAEVESVMTQNPSEREINKASKKQGILNMAEDGVIKILQGMTSFSELSKTVDLKKSLEE